MICKLDFWYPSGLKCLHSRYKYLTAYIPLVSFYYRGKVIYRFKATESYEELLHQVSIMTGEQVYDVLIAVVMYVCMHVCV